ncbi:MAG: hypothetical protein ACK4VO_06410 [Pseudobdellovibrio sp.]
MKKIFLLIMTSFTIAEANNQSQENILALNFVQKKFAVQIPPAQIVESPNLKFHAFTSPSENIIYVRSGMSETELKINLVHEYTHRVRYKYNQNDAPWFSEGLAQLVEMSYTSWPYLYSDNLFYLPEIKISKSQTEYENNSRAYADSFYLMYYIYSHFGRDDLLQKMMRSPLTGWDNILTSIAELQSEEKIFFKDIKINREYIIKHFAVALAVNDPYIAQYSLFYIHPAYNKIIDKEFISNDRLENNSQNDFEIVYAKKRLSEKFESQYQLKYSIDGLTPFTIRSIIDNNQKSLIYIYIRL